MSEVYEEESEEDEKPMVGIAEEEVEEEVNQSDHTT